MLLGYSNSGPQQSSYRFIYQVTFLIAAIFFSFSELNAGAVATAVDQAEFDRNIVDRISSFSWEDRPPYVVVGFDNPGKNLLSVRGALYEYVESVSVDSSDPNKIAWQGSEDTMLLYLGLIDPFTVNQAMYEFDMGLWEKIGEMPQLLYVAKEELVEGEDPFKVTLVHADGRPYTLEEIFTAYGKIHVDGNKWSGSEHSRRIYTYMQQVLIHDMLAMSMEPEMRNNSSIFSESLLLGKPLAGLIKRLRDNFEEQREANSVWTLERINRDFPRLERLLAYTEWFPRSYAFIVLTDDVEGGGRQFSFEDYTYRPQPDEPRNRYPILLKRYFSDVADKFDEVIDDSKEAYETAWSYVRDIGEGQPLRDFEDQLSTEFTELFGVSLDVTKMTDGEVDEHEEAIRLVWSDLTQGYKVRFGAYNVNIPGSTHLSGNIVKRIYGEAEVVERFFAHSFTYHHRTESYSPIDILIKPTEVIGGVARVENRFARWWYDGDVRKMDENSILFSIDQLRAYYKGTNNAREFDAMFAPAIKTFGPTAVAFPFIGPGGFLAKPFWTGVAIHEANVVTASIYHSFSQGRLVLPTIMDVTVGALSSGNMFAAGGGLGSSLARLSYLSKPMAHTLGMATAGVGFAKYDGASWTHAGVQGLRMGLYGVGGAYATRMGMFPKSAFMRYGTVFVFNSSISAHGAAIEEMAGGYIDVLGYTAKGDIAKAALMGIFSSIGMDAASVRGVGFRDNRGSFNADRFRDSLQDKVADLESGRGDDIVNLNDHRPPTNESPIHYIEDHLPTQPTPTSPNPSGGKVIPFPGPNGAEPARAAAIGAEGLVEVPTTTDVRVGPESAGPRLVEQTPVIQATRGGGQGGGSGFGGWRGWIGGALGRLLPGGSSRSEPQSRPRREVPPEEQEVERTARFAVYSGDSAFYRFGEDPFFRGRTSGVEVTYRLNAQGEPQITGIQAHYFISARQGDIYGPRIANDDVARMALAVDQKGAPVGGVDVYYNVTSDGRVVMSHADIRFARTDVDVVFHEQGGHETAFRDFLQRRMDETGIDTRRLPPDEARAQLSEWTSEFYRWVEETTGIYRGDLDSMLGYLEPMVFIYRLTPDSRFTFTGYDHGFLFRDGAVPAEPTLTATTARPEVTTHVNRVRGRIFDPATRRRVAGLFLDVLGRHQNFAETDLLPNLRHQIGAFHAEPVMGEVVPPREVQLTELYQQGFNNSLHRAVESYRRGNTSSAESDLRRLWEVPSEIVGASRPRRLNAGELEWLFSQHPDVDTFRILGIESFADLRARVEMAQGAHQRQTRAFLAEARDLEAELRRTGFGRDEIAAVQENFAARPGTQRYNQLLQYLLGFRDLVPGQAIATDRLRAAFEGEPFFTDILNRAIDGACNFRVATAEEMASRERGTAAAWYNPTTDEVVWNPRGLTRSPFEMSMGHELAHRFAARILRDPTRLERAEQNAFRQLAEERGQTVAEVQAELRALTVEHGIENLHLVDFLMERHARENEQRLHNHFRQTQPHLLTTRHFFRQFMASDSMASDIAREVSVGYDVHPAVADFFSNVDTNRMVEAAEGFE